MTLYLETNGDFAIWNPSEPINEARYQPNLEDVWTADELAGIGLYSPAVPAVPTGKLVTNTSVQRVNGTVTYVYTLQDMPGAVDMKFPPLEPWQFWSVIDLSGVGEQALYDAIDLIPDDAFKVKSKRKLANPPGGVFKRSDPLFSNPFLMMQLSLSKEQIDALWVQGLAFE